MSQEYQELESDIAELLGELGAPLIITSTTAGSFDPVTGQESGKAEVEQTGFGVVVDYKTDQIDGANILQGDKRVFIEASVLPEISDTVTISTKKYSIVGVREVSPSGINLLYELHVRS